MLDASAFKAPKTATALHFEKARPSFRKFGQLAMSAKMPGIHLCHSLPGYDEKIVIVIR